MKKHALWFTVFSLLTLNFTARATITNAVYAPYYNGALYNCTMNFDANAQTLSMHGDQAWGPGSDHGTFYADSLDDPRSTRLYFIGNDTTGAWSDYHVNVYLDRSFSISNAFTTLPANWSVVITAPVLNPTPVYFGAGEYVGHITYNAGTLVPNDGSELDFQYDIGFAGSLTYRFADELSPSFVPEPATLSLAALGGLLLVIKRRRQPPANGR
jgi:hypothetical protein